MERLTERTGEGQAIPRMDLKNNGHQKCMERLAEYEDLEEQGKLLKLPCAVGDMIYKVSPNYVYVDMCQITGFAECNSTKSMCYTVYIDPDEEDIIALSDFGKTVFLTREEAEDALKEVRE